ncbi:unnamed protein product [Rotaria magnacalcarata]|uniref:G-protein coupled receptors family 1 profile domain-containing protein n=1 Tax=Rotaria magnacalcarata TaxID=392030 RepID=A0A820B8Y4_9BILA|nr:unnamed protein product [Rotaria magnacalcarata]CAF4188996.1 unnamed protein product [Rotaria magnacalcarata]
MHRLISLTAAFRLFRVVYYKTRIPQQFYVFIIAVAVLWLLSFLFILPHIVLHDFQYQSFDCGCPLLIIVIIYAYILRYVRRTMATQRERQRDAIVLRRIVIFLLFLVLFGVTTLSILVIYSITSYLIPFAPEIQTVHTSIGLVSTPTTRARRKKQTIKLYCQIQDLTLTMQADSDFEKDYLIGLKSSDFYNDSLCPLRGYFLHVFICAFFYSCLLQAIFRLFRVAFYKLNSRKSHYLFLIGIFLTWFIAFLYILLHLLKHDFEYTSLAYGCWISFANVYGLFQALLVMYVGPNSTVCLIYAYIVRYSRRKTHIQPHQQKLNSRDLIILKRIVIIVLVAMGIGIATLITFLVYIITNYLVPTAYHLQGLSISGGFFMGSVGFAFITPQIKDIFLMKKQRIAPVIVVDVIL